MDAAETPLDPRSLLRQLDKTRRTLRLYGAANAVVEQMEAELEAQCERHLRAAGQLDLEVREDGLWLGKEQVLAGEGGAQDLPYLLFRDGVRSLSLLPGVDRAQLHAFLELVNRVGVASSDDDLVTLLWESDLRAVRTVVAEDLEGESAAAEGEPPAELALEAGPKVNLADLSQPVAHLPVAECQLDEQEVARLHAELEAEEREDLLRSTVELALELLLLEPDEDDWRVSVETVSGVLDRTLAEGRLGAVLSALADLDRLARGQPPLPAAGRLLAEVVAALASPEGVEKALAPLAAPGREDPGTLAAYLTLLGPAAVPALAAWIPRLGEGELRRVVTVATLTASPGGVAQLLDALPEDAGARATLLLEMLHAARQADPQAAATVARRALAQPEGWLRRQAVQALGPFQDGPVGALWMELVADPDPEVRRLALATLVRSGRGELAQPIAEATLLPEFADLTLEEKQRFYAAVARLGGDRGLPWFESVLRQPLPRWFVPRQARETVEAMARALAGANTPAARRLLEELARSGERAVRSACKDALKGRGAGDDA